MVRVDVPADNAAIVSPPQSSPYPEVMFTGTDSMRIAIEILTLWREPGDEARMRACEHIIDVVLGGSTESEQRQNAITAVGGLLNISDLLLLRVAQREGAESKDEIAMMAGEILRSISPQLPE